MRLSRPKRLDPASIRLPLIALIDVILFILLYFMLAGTLANEEADLATALHAEKAQAAAAADLLPQTVNVEAVGGVVQYRMGERVLPDRAALTAVLRQLPHEMGVVIKVRGDVPVAAAAAAVQASKDAGFTKVSYVPVH
ncbi:MAG: biopolymer transporter ExbD [Phycisphaerales bacterium]|nr:biopolymer transporter ExbD [Phycisphaerales bacterium]